MLNNAPKATTETQDSAPATSTTPSVHFAYRGAPREISQPYQFDLRELAPTAPIRGPRL